MSVDIKFEPDGPEGVVAEGSVLLDAARRLGFHIPADCDGRGECDTCAVSVTAGANLLSSLTDGERIQLSSERLAGGERLACQCKVEHGGELKLRLVTRTERSATAEETTRDLKREFSRLTFERKIATLIQLETIAVSEAMDSIAARTASLGKKLFDSVMPSTGSKNQPGTKPPAGPDKK